MKIQEFEGYELHIPTSGGKAGKGNNKTSTVQIRKNNCIVHQYRFKCDSHLARIRAEESALAWVIRQNAKATQPEKK